jgi:hypothetical protein
MAKHKLTSILPNIATLQQQPFYLQMEKCSIYWHDRCTRGIKICSELKPTLIALIHTNTIQQHWMKGHIISGYTESFVDWEATQRSQRNISKSRQWWMSKWMTDFCGMGIMLVQYSYQKHSKCLYSQQSNESTAHIIQCPNPDAISLWEMEVHNLHKWMQDNYGEPSMINIIRDNLLGWRTSPRGYHYIPQNDLL